jgi:uncharacterized protein (TIGR00725 family)
VTGGLGGVMEAALRGAAASRAFRDGDTLALLPGADPAAANRWASIVIPTGLGHHRNGVVAAADAVVAVGGGAGTLSEVAFAWVWGRAPIVVVTGLPGVTASLAGQRLDGAAVGAREEVRCGEEGGTGGSRLGRGGRQCWGRRPRRRLCGSWLRGWQLRGSGPVGVRCTGIKLERISIIEQVGAYYS